jgi:hypothetical protein
MKQAKLSHGREATPLQRTLEGASWHSASYRLIAAGQWRALIRHVVRDLGATFALLLHELGDELHTEEWTDEEFFTVLEHPRPSQHIASRLLRSQRIGLLDHWECHRLLEALELVDDCGRGSGNSQPRPIAHQALRLFVSAELAAAIVRRQVQR